MLPALEASEQFVQRTVDNRLVFNLHPGQGRAIKSTARQILLLAGRQSGKTLCGPIWLLNEIKRRGPGDYLIAGPDYQLLDKKALPEFLGLFRNRLRYGGLTGKSQHFKFNSYGCKQLWGEVPDVPTKVFFGHAKAPESLESATIKAVWLDECCAPETLIATEYGAIPISAIVNRQMPLRVWSYSTSEQRWELRPVVRWIKTRQRRPLLKIGNTRLTGNHKIWTREKGYLTLAAIAFVHYNTSSSKTNLRGTHACIMSVLPGAVKKGDSKVLLAKLLGQMARYVPDDSSKALSSKEEVLAGLSQEKKSNRRHEENFRSSDVPQGGVGAYDEGNVRSGTSQDYFRRPEEAILQSCQSSLGATQRCCQFGAYAEGETEVEVQADETRQALAAWRKWQAQELEAGETSGGSGVAERVCCTDRRQEAVGYEQLQDRCSRANFEDRYRGGQPGQSQETGLVCEEWVDLSTLYQSHGGDVAGGVSSDGCVYNLEVEENHNYVADGLLVANCGQRSFKLDSYDAIRGRVTINQGRILMTTTPYSISWLKQQIWDRAGLMHCWDDDLVVHETRHPDRDQDIHVVSFNSLLNPAFPRSEFQKMVETLPKWKMDLFYRGRFTRPAGAVYDCFDEVKFVCEPFMIPDSWPKFVGLDFGGVHTAAVKVAVALSPDGVKTGRLYVYEEYPKDGWNSMTAKAHAEQLLKGHAKKPTAVGGSGSEDQWRKEFASGGLFVHEPPIREVDVGIQRVYSAMKAGELYVFNTCRRLLSDITEYSYKLDTSGNVTDELEDKADFHFCDAARYIISHLRGPKKEIWIR